MNVDVPSLLDMVEAVNLGGSGSVASSKPSRWCDGLHTTLEVRSQATIPFVCDA